MTGLNSEEDTNKDWGHPTKKEKTKALHCVVTVMDVQQFLDLQHQHLNPFNFGSSDQKTQGEATNWHPKYRKCPV